MTALDQPGLDQPRTWFTSIEDSTAEDWALLEDEDVEFRAGLAGRVTQHLLLLDEQDSIFPVSAPEPLPADGHDGAPRWA